MNNETESKLFKIFECLVSIVDHIHEKGEYKNQSIQNSPTTMTTYINKKKKVYTPLFSPLCA
jgi:hypothetical protein